MCAAVDARFHSYIVLPMAEITYLKRSGKLLNSNSFYWL